MGTGGYSQSGVLYGLKSLNGRARGIRVPYGCSICNDATYQRLVGDGQSLLLLAPASSSQSGKQLQARAASLSNVTYVRGKSKVSVKNNAKIFGTPL